MVGVHRGAEGLVVMVVVEVVVVGRDGCCSGYY